MDVYLSCLQPAIMPRVDGWQTAGGPCTLGLDVNNGYQECGHVDSPNELIFPTRDTGGSLKIAKLQSLSHLNS